MIKESDVFKIGKMIKPHGIKGEIAFAFENDIFDKVDCPYLICKIDGILVPFFLTEHRFKGKDTALISFEDIDNENKAQRFSGEEVYFPRKYYDEETEVEIDYSWNFFIGFKVIDKIAGELGIIEAIDDQTINTLFLIKDENNTLVDEYIIPATEEFITDIDTKNKILHLELPEGLIT